MLCNLCSDESPKYSRVCGIYNKGFAELSGAKFRETRSSRNYLHQGTRRLHDSVPSAANSALGGRVATAALAVFRWVGPSRSAERSHWATFADGFPCRGTYVDKCLGGYLQTALPRDNSRRSLLPCSALYDLAREVKLFLFLLTIHPL